MPFLDHNALGIDFLLRRDVIDIMHKICPDDFQALPVKLLGKDKEGNEFESNLFFDINPLGCIDAIDQNKSNIKRNSRNEVEIVGSLLRYKSNPWQEGAISYIIDNKEYSRSFHLEKPLMLAIDVLTGVTVWNPELVKHFPRDSYHWFMRLEEADKYKWPPPLPKKKQEEFEKLYKLTAPIREWFKS